MNCTYDNKTITVIVLHISGSNNNIHVSCVLTDMLLQLSEDILHWWFHSTCFTKYTPKALNIMPFNVHTLHVFLPPSICIYIVLWMRKYNYNYVFVKLLQLIYHLAWFHKLFRSSSRKCILFNTNCGRCSASHFSNNR